MLLVNILTLLVKTYFYLKGCLAICDFLIL